MEEKKFKFSKYYEHITKGNILTNNNLTTICSKKNKKISLTCLTLFNDIPRLNSFLKNINNHLEKESYFFGVFEMSDKRREKINKKYFFPFNLFIYTFDYLIHRFSPRITILKKIYFFFTKNKLKVISRAEAYGRLYYLGFIIVDEKIMGDKVFFVTKKKDECKNKMDLKNGPIIKLDRIGKGGKVFFVYKLRTMHAYSQFLQEYIYNQNDLKMGGKINDDFRISFEGKFFRKFWIDELPMILNVLKGQMKIVGIRPLSPHYFSLYSEKLKNMRIKCKPGLIPPFYYDMPNTFEEIMKSEQKYLKSYFKNPIKTDIKYFFGAIKNILFGGARSS